MGGSLPLSPNRMSRRPGGAADNSTGIQSTHESALLNASNWLAGRLFTL